MLLKTPRKFLHREHLEGFGEYRGKHQLVVIGDCALKARIFLLANVDKAHLETAMSLTGILAVDETTKHTGVHNMRAHSDPGE